MAPVRSGLLAHTETGKLMASAKPLLLAARQSVYAREHTIAAAPTKKPPPGPGAPPAAPQQGTGGIG